MNSDKLTQTGPLATPRDASFHRTLLLNLKSHYREREQANPQNT